MLDSPLPRQGLLYIPTLWKGPGAANAPEIGFASLLEDALFECDFALSTEQAGY